MVTHRITWKPGSSTYIRLGKDSILGLEQNSFLSPILLSLLKRRGLHFLYQMAGLGRQGAVLARWKSALEVGLADAEANELTHFSKDLNRASISLTDQPDELI